ncbi:ABC transporter permease [Enterococcus columbae]|uniref:ABC transporter permease n=1 Tax=Enterococcus columbae DSM 7374 = ATCC 51263 TaxID=1121865 RepID=S0KJM4_9ENTE|nr:ABC transporter permease [Enterococcus columbae]EOT44907.1 hypothetical protein OMW_00093 [Enterococcus columbae DSM 7374 = ATCC 51263]EOW84200.1 hypothetical protein I568_00687 [Enterococcus columbae DSM 7374 = ATCC 51263]
MSYLTIEWLKLKKAASLGIGIIFILFSSIIGLAIFFGAAYNMYQPNERFMALWLQLSFYYSQLFFLIMISIIVYLALSEEFARKNLAFLRANNFSMPKLILAKAINVFFITILLQLIFYAVFFGAVKFANISYQVKEIQQVFQWLLNFAVASMTLIFTQLFITLKTKSLSKSIGIATLGMIIGFILLFINKNLTNFFPYSQVQIAMHARSGAPFTIRESLRFFMVNSLYIFLFYWLSCRELRKEA